MSDNFGLKIGIEGEKTFKQALSDINQSFKVLGSEMNLVASHFDKQDRSIEAITARNQVLNKEIDTQKEKIGTLEKALGNATSSFGENDRRTKAWAVQLNNAKAELNVMERELEQNIKDRKSVV
jgi:phage-related minor tail protein